MIEIELQKRKVKEKELNNEELKAALDAANQELENRKKQGKQTEIKLAEA